MKLNKLLIVILCFATSGIIHADKAKAPSHDPAIIAEANPTAQATYKAAEAKFNRDSKTRNCSKIGTKNYNNDVAEFNNAYNALQASIKNDVIASASPAARADYTAAENEYNKSMKSASGRFAGAQKDRARAKFATAYPTLKASIKK